LPTSLALSDKEAEKIEGFLRFPQDREQSHIVFADGTPGLFDAHCKLRPCSPLEGHLPVAVSSARSGVVFGNFPPQRPKEGDIARYGADRLKVTPSLEWAEWIEKQLAPFKREVSVPASARVQIYRYRLGTAQLVALERNISYAMSEELKQAGGNEALEQPIEIEASLARPAHVYDLRTQKYLGQISRISCQIEPWQPSLFALLPEKVAEAELMARLSR
jgi:hypothetical protein